MSLAAELQLLPRESFKVESKRTVSKEHEDDEHCY